APPCDAGAAVYALLAGGPLLPRPRDRRRATCPGGPDHRARAGGRRHRGDEPVQRDRERGGRAGRAYPRGQRRPRGIWTAPPGAGVAMDGVLTVGEVTRYLKVVLESDVLLTNVWITGEVSNLSHSA